MAARHGEDHAPGEGLETEDNVAHGNEPYRATHSGNQAKQDDSFQKAYEYDKEPAEVELLCLECGREQGEHEQERNAHEHVDVCRGENGRGGGGADHCHGHCRLGEGEEQKRH